MGLSSTNRTGGADIYSGAQQPRMEPIETSPYQGGFLRGTEPISSLSSVRTQTDPAETFPSQPTSISSPSPYPEAQQLSGPTFQATTGVADPMRFPRGELIEPFPQQALRPSPFGSGIINAINDPTLAPQFQAITDDLGPRRRGLFGR